MNYKKKVKKPVLTKLGRSKLGEPKANVSLIIEYRSIRHCFKLPGNYNEGKWG